MPTALVTLLLALGLLLAPGAQAQNYAASGFGLAGYFADGDCSDPAAPCFLRAALQDATDGGASGSSVFVRVSNVGGVTFVLHQFLAIAAPVGFDTYLDDGIPTTGVAGSLVFEGRVEVAANTAVTLPPHFRLRLQGDDLGPGVLELGVGSSFEGGGELALKGPRQIVIGTPVGPPASGTAPLLENLLVDGRSGVVTVWDGNAGDSVEELRVESLRVQNGVLDLGDIVLEVRGAPTRLEVAQGAEIRGNASMRLRLDEGVFPNTEQGALRIGGGGRILMNFVKFYDGGLVYELPELGGGGTTRNFKGLMLFPQPVTIHGSFIHEPEDGSPARTEFQAAAEISGDVVFPNPGGELPPGDGVCGTGDESELWFHAPVHIHGDLVLHDTDDLATSPCVEGVTFSPLGLLGGSQARSFVDGVLSASGSTSLTLGSAGIAHNLEVAGDIAFAESPLITLQDPSPGGESCQGNELVFGGPRNPQSFAFQEALAVPSLRVQKLASGGGVVVAPASGLLLANTAITVARGIFQDNGSLDPTSVLPVEGLSCAACPVFPRDDCLQTLEPRSALLVLSAAKGKLNFKWTRGEETKPEQLGSPATLTDYSFCLYDEVGGTPRLALAASLPGGPSWAETATGAVYSRANRVPDGITKAKIKTGPDGIAKLIVAGKGMTLPPLPLAQSPRVVAQVVNSAGTCWSAEFRNFARRNTARKFKDRE